ncbi:MAG: PAS domain S-box protein [Anaerolineae bacterium]|nr:PAS domain S-box protein [Anaerolineae bacterium]
MTNTQHQEEYGSNKKPERLDRTGQGSGLNHWDFSEQKYHELFESAPEAILILALDGAVLDFNTATKSILNIEKEEILGNPFTDLHVIKRASVPEYQAVFKQVRNGEALHSYQVTLNNRWLEIFPSRLEHEGSPYAVQLIARDITEQKKAEQALEAAKWEKEMILDSQTEHVIYQDKAHRILWPNQPACEAAGLAREELIGQYCYDIWPDLHRKHGDDCPVTLAIKIGRKHQAVKKTADGRVWLIRGHPVRNAYDEIVGGIEVRKDITDQIHVENAIEQYTARLRILHKIDQAILSAQSSEAIADSALIYVKQLVPCQRTSVTLFDYERQEAHILAVNSDGETQLGKNVRFPVNEKEIDTLFKTHQVSFMDNLAQPSQRGPKEQLLFDEGIKSQVNIGMIAHGIVIGSLNLGATQANAFTEDQIEAATEIANQLAIALQQTQLYEQVQSYASELEARVQERTAQLEAANRELEAFSYSVSHDLRAPLRSIDGFSLALLEDYADCVDDIGRDYLKRVRTASQRMAELIDDILRLSRITRTRIHQERVDLSALVQDVASELQQLDPERQVTITIQPHIIATGDRSLLKIVLENLIGNAWKFTRDQPQAKIEFSTQQQANTTIYYIKDNGAGFDMAYANKLFGAFQRLHTITEFEGNGIGLATVQRIIHKHGGKIWAEGEINKGATFYFTLRAN